MHSQSSPFPHINYLIDVLYHGAGALDWTLLWCCGASNLHRDILGVTGGFCITTFLCTFVTILGNKQRENIFNPLSASLTDDGDHILSQYKW